MNQPVLPIFSRSPRFALRPLARSLALSVAVATTCSAVVLFSTPVHAQTRIGPVSAPYTGTTPPDGSGGQGGLAPSPNWIYGDVIIGDDGNGTPALSMSSVGGNGGTGQDGNPPGSGGNGGNGGAVSLTLQSSASVVGTSTGPAVVTLVSTGGTGGTDGQMTSSQGMPGHPGSGGDSGSVQMTQDGAVSSANGWNGNTPGTTAVSLVANGGNAAQPLGGNGAQGGGNQNGPAGGNGGAGGTIVYTLNQGSVTSAGSGIAATSQGGNGGDGYEAYGEGGTGYGGNGGYGGAGNSVQITTGSASGPSPTITATGAPTAATGAVIPINADGTPAQAAVMAAGILAQSLGGEGGKGGSGDGTSGGKAGSGGNAGAAGSVTIGLAGTNIQTTGFAAAGVLAQSVGGSGGNGSGAGGVFFAKAGSGGLGGNGNTVIVNMAEQPGVGWSRSVISTTGDDSMGVVAQSIGGGGGAGGAVETGSLVAGIALGGNGESGGTGGVVSVSNGAAATADSSAQPGFIINTQGEHSSGLVAQSIGGGGGSGGSATNSVLGPFTYTVGGSGGSGGNAGTPGATQVSVLNEGIVNTAGDHAKGIVAQAVGGGGGDGGSAQALTASGQLNINVAVGGSGGAGGNSGDVTGTNNGEVLTNGSDAWGLLTQSVAGGGGNGGMSKSQAFQFAGTQAIPSVTINASIGGSGGDGGSSGNVTAANNGVIMTAGAAAHGILAQSVAGGGGNGGDSSAMTAGAGAGKGGKLDITLAIGGTGGTGGTGGAVTVDNSSSSLIWTLGESADGIFAQSVGGGGGAGGTGSATNKFLGQSGAGGTSTVSLGGLGGKGSQGGTVTVTNEGNIMTMGDGANGIFAQSVGGGGGLATGGTISGSGGKFSQKITMAGSTETGSSAPGGQVSATNSATILTYGGAAAGMLVQSVGGGGGVAGTGTTAGLPLVNSPTGSLSDYLATSTVLKNNIGNYGGVNAWGPGGWYLSSIQQMETWGQDYLSYAANNTSGTLPDGTGGEATVQLFMGGGTGVGGGPGSGGTAGDGGTVNATNNFWIQTQGPASPGIAAQSVGAGGGMSGAASVNHYETTTDNSTQVTMQIGGTANNAGDGGAVTAANNGVISTQGDASFGMFAQSVGGGGGQSLVTASSVQPFESGPSVSITLAGQNTSTGNGGAVSASAGANSSISTAGNDAVGIVAQSVGGGGGNAIVMSTSGNAQGLATGHTQSNEVGTATLVSVGSNTYFYPPDYPYLTGCAVAGTYVMNSCGTGGAVTVSTAAGSTVSTSGVHAHGILAQSIGGGGGWVVGVAPPNVQPFVKDPNMGGDGGAVNVSVGGLVKTTNNLAFGVLAQSVGGGGILGGYVATGDATQFQQDGNGNGEGRIGSGGNVEVDVSGTVSTSGGGAHGVFAQSVGGGGGLWTSFGGTLMGSVGGQGNAGSITINNTGTIEATGAQASAVFTNSAGRNKSSGVTVNNSGSIIGNASAPAIMLTGGNNNGDGTVNNSGLISNPGGTAVGTIGGSAFAVVNNNTGGQVVGDVQLGGKGTFNNNGGVWSPGPGSTAGTFNNGAGAAINLGATMTSMENAGPTTVLTGAMTGGNANTLISSGNILTTMDFSAQTSSSLQIYGGSAQFNGGQFVVTVPNGAGLAPNPVAFFEADEGYSIGSGVTAINAANSSVSYSMSTRVGEIGDMWLSLTPSTQFAAVGATKGYSANQVSLAQHLDAGFTKSMTPEMSRVYGRLAGMDDAHVQGSMDALGNEAVQSVGVARMVASQDFVERMNSCPQFGPGGTQQTEQDCLWSRAMNNDTHLDGSSTRVGYGTNASKFQIGGQKGVGEGWFLGGSVGYDNASLFAPLTSVSGTGWMAALIAKKQLGDWIFSGAVDAGHGSYDSQRQVLLGDAPEVASASFGADHVGLHGRVARQIPLDGWYLKPYVDLHAIHLRTDAYSESGANGLNLQVNAASGTSYTVTPMVEAGSLFDVGNGMALRGYASAGAAFSNHNAWTASASLQGSVPEAGTFQTTSEIPDQRFKMNVGADLIATKNLDVRVEYTGEFASGFRSNGGMIKAAYSF